MTQAGVGAPRIIEEKWAIERLLGEGGMGSVFLARDLELGRRVAIKMMSKHLLNEAELVTRFAREARIMARLDHPNLVPVYAVGEHDQTPFIVMKYLEGVTLSDLLSERKRLEGVQLLSLMKQICEGLQFMHEQRVVHRDLKPANIFVSPAGHVTLLDLGVARETNNTMTRTGMLMGTPRYMAPEQITGRHATPATDLYALAAICFELVTGRPVFHAETDFELMRLHVDTLPPDAATLIALPPGSGAVLQKGLSKDPAQRHASARDFYRALEAAWNSGPPVPVAGASQPVRSSQSLATPVPASTAAEVPVSESELDVPRSRFPALIAAGLGALVVAGGLVAWRPWSSGGTAVVDRKPLVEPNPTGQTGPVVDRPPVAESPPVVKSPTVVESPPVVDARPVRAPPGAETRPSFRGTAEVTFAAKAKGGPVPAFVDIDGERQQATPFVQSLKVGPHRVVFRRVGAEPVTRDITVVAGKPLKVLVEMAQ